MTSPRFKAAAVVCLAAAAVLLPARSASAEAPTKYPYKITCTVGMITDIVRHVAGDKATVEGIIGEGVDPHLYQPTRNDIVRLINADIIFYNGLLLEGKMSDALVRVARKKPVYPVTELIDRKLLLEPPEFEGHQDPHVWMDPTLWKKATEMVAKTLGEFDKPNKGHYQSNAMRYAKKIDALHTYAKRTLATIPEKSRVLVTAHDAFNYFSRAYGMKVRGIQGISTESKAGLKDINSVIDLLVEKKVGAVFVESSVSEKNVKALVEGAAARGHTVKIGGTLFSDAMGKPGTYEGTYIGMIDHNVTTVVRALGGQAPEKGMQGKLDPKSSSHE